MNAKNLYKFIAYVFMTMHWLSLPATTLPPLPFCFFSILMKMSFWYKISSTYHTTIQKMIYLDAVQLLFD